MTAKRLNRIRRRYNAMRRANRGWTPISWTWLVERFEADAYQLRRLGRLFER